MSREFHAWFAGRCSRCSRVTVKRFVVREGFPGETPVMFPQHGVVLSWCGHRGARLRPVEDGAMVVWEDG